MKPRLPAALREPMVWLAIALPLASVAGTIAMLAAASDGDGFDAVAEPVRRTGQIQQADVAPDLEAQRLGLHATLRREGNGIDVRLVDGSVEPRVPVLATLEHPTLATRDLRLVLSPDGRGWSTDADVAADHDWRITLAPVDHAWRLQGRLRAHADHAALAPALGDGP